MVDLPKNKDIVELFIGSTTERSLYGWHAIRERAYVARDEFVSTRQAARLARVRLGWLLLQIRPAKAHGQWQAWLASVGVHVKTARRAIDDAVELADQLGVATREQLAAACMAVWPWIFTGYVANLDFERAKWAASCADHRLQEATCSQREDIDSAETLKKDKLSVNGREAFGMLNATRQVAAGRRMLHAAAVGLRSNAMTTKQRKCVRAGLELLVDGVAGDGELGASLLHGTSVWDDLGNGENRVRLAESRKKSGGNSVA